MTPIERLWNGLLGWRRWNREGRCPDGVPVPEGGRCRDLECDSVPLTELAPGEEGTVTCLEEPGSREARKLMAMGVLPGASLRLLQRYPAFVFRMGYGEFAVDGTLAALIRVRRAGAGDGVTPPASPP